MRYCQEPAEDTVLDRRRKSLRRERRKIPPNGQVRRGGKMAKSDPGIGDWSSKLILLRGLGRMEKIAVEKRLLKAASKVYGRGRTLTQSVLDHMAEKNGL